MKRKTILGFLFFLIILLFLPSCAAPGPDPNANNFPPTRPLLIEPANGATGVENDPTLRWNVSVDLDGDPVQYVILFATNVIHSGDVFVDATETRSIQLHDLSEGTWWWRVMSVDPGKRMSRSDRWSFTVGDFPLPVEAQGNSVESQYLVNTTGGEGIELNWPRFENPENAAAPIFYDIRIDENPEQMAQARVFQEYSTTTSQLSLRVPGFGTHTLYEGWIHARDEHDAQVEVGHFFFTGDNQPPSAVSTPQPGDGQVHVDADAFLGWSAARDPDGDALVYDVYVSDGSQAQGDTRFSRDGRAYVRAGSDLEETRFQPVQPFQPGREYAWVVVARDEYGGFSVSPEWTLRASNATPTALQAILPEDGATAQPVELTLQWSASDADGDALEYSVWMAKGDHSLELLEEGLTQPELALSNLDYDSEYRWQVSADDGQEMGARAVATSAVFRFSTSAPPNEPPAAPSNPQPANLAQGVSVDTTLSWNCSDPDHDTLSYRVYLSTSSSNWPAPAQVTSTSYDPGTLAHATRYYWKVVADDGKASGLRATTSSAVWSFTTEAAPNNPPNQPTNPDPQDGATDVATSLTLSWECSDLDAGDTLSYEVYCATDTSLYASPTSVSATSCLLEELRAGETYFWKVVADDGKDSTTGPDWSFTTVSLP